MKLITVVKTVFDRFLSVLKTGTVSVFESLRVSHLLICERLGPREQNYSPHTRTTTRSNWCGSGARGVPPEQAAQLGGLAIAYTTNHSTRRFITRPWGLKSTTSTNGPTRVHVYLHRRPRLDESIITTILWDNTPNQLSYFLSFIFSIYFQLVNLLPLV
jgi:hypothetical protein